MSKQLLIINPNSGRARRSSELQTLLDATKPYPDLETRLLKRGDNIYQIVQQAITQGVELFGVAGGDGTINAVASTLIGTKIPLVVIPFGTLNHFARDIGIPSDLKQALALFEQGADEVIDVGAVNGHYFLNNSSVGLYPSLVKEREKHEKRLGKGLAYLLAGWKVLRHPWLMRVKLTIEGETKDLKAAIIFFANNRIDTTPLLVGQRPRLDGQMLDAFVVKASTIWQFFWVATSFMRNKLEQSPLIARSEVCEATVYTKRHHLQVACDGEVLRLTPPLNYSIKSAALVVRVPPEKVASKEQNLAAQETPIAGSEIMDSAM